MLSSESLDAAVTLSSLAALAAMLEVVILVVSELRLLLRERFGGVRPATPAMALVEGDELRSKAKWDDPAALERGEAIETTITGDEVPFILDRGNKGDRRGS